MRERTGCFTGHRQIPEKDYAVIEEKLEQTIVKLYNNGIIRYCAGGALGFDTLAAETVLRLRETYSELRLILVLPCKDQARGWKAKDVDKYEKIRQRADETVYTSEIYATGCMHKRNRQPGTPGLPQPVGRGVVYVCAETERIQAGNHLRGFQRNPQRDRRVPGEYPHPGTGKRVYFSGKGQSGNPARQRICGRFPPPVSGSGGSLYLVEPTL